MGEFEDTPILEPAERIPLQVEPYSNWWVEGRLLRLRVGQGEVRQLVTLHFVAEPLVPNAAVMSSSSLMPNEPPSLQMGPPKALLPEQLLPNSFVVLPRARKHIEGSRAAEKAPYPRA